MHIDINSVFEVGSESQAYISNFEPSDEWVWVQEIDDGNLDWNRVFRRWIDFQWPAEPVHNLATPFWVHYRDAEEKVITELESEVGDREKREIEPEEVTAWCLTRRSSSCWSGSIICWTVTHKRSPLACVWLIGNQTDIGWVHQVKIDEGEHVGKSVEQSRNDNSKVKRTPSQRRILTIQIVHQLSPIVRLVKLHHVFAFEEPVDAKIVLSIKVIRLFESSSWSLFNILVVKHCIVLELVHDGCQFWFKFAFMFLVDLQSPIFLLLVKVDICEPFARAWVHQTQHPKLQTLFVDPLRHDLLLNFYVQASGRDVDPRSCRQWIWQGFNVHVAAFRDGNPWGGTGCVAGCNHTRTSNKSQKPEGK